MATTTTNFGWDIPQSTDLVKDGATAIAALGQDIDTAFVDLKGGTTGQVLAKASGTDLDFSWVAQDDSNAIQNTQLTAKGALISAFSAGTPATLTVGTNGQVLTADSAEATGLKWAAAGGGGGMTVINSGTVTSGTLNVGSIPGTYNHLQLWIYEFDPGANLGTPAFRFNSDSTNKYQKAVTSALSSSGAGYWHMDSPMSPTVATGLVVVNIYQYANTGQNKMFQAYMVGASNANASYAAIDTAIGMYNASGAITSIQSPFNNEGNTDMSFKWTLYGVK
jgi:hypothetical protein